MGPERTPGELTPPFLRGSDHARGDGGPVILIFGDYEDPASAALYREAEALEGVTLSWRHLPRGELHPHANGAALAAEGAAAQDAFWAFHHVLLASQDALTVPDLFNHAAAIGLDIELLMDDMREGRHTEQVLDHVRSAVDSGVTETPGLFVDGVRRERL